jgi:hypothetical protein
MQRRVMELCARLRHVLFLAALLLALPASAAPSYPKQWELGFMLGSPTGLSVKRWMGGATAFDLGVGVGPGVRFHGDYLLALAEPARGPDVSLDLYLGGGAVVGVGRGYCSYYRRGTYCDGDFYVGGRVPLGLDLRLRRAPVAIGLELAPGLVFGPFGAGGIFDAFLYVRFVLPD